MTGGASSQAVPHGQSPIKSYFDAVLELLGLTGLMFGSDWPVLTLACDYSRWINVFRRVISKLNKHLAPLSDKRIALLGLAFKPDTDDMREASSLVLAARLLGEGAGVRAYDPVAREAAGDLLPPDVELRSSALEALDGADAAVLVTEWPEFAELDWSEVAKRMNTPLIVDGRNFLDAEAIRGAGLVYEGIGKPQPAGAAEPVASAEGSDG